MELCQPMLTSGLSWETAVEAFLFSRKVMGVSPRTLEWHASDLKMFINFPNHNCQSPLTCNKEHCQAYLTWLQSRGIRPVTINGKFRSLRAFFNWLIKEGLRVDNPVNAITLPEESQPLPRTVTEKHFLAAISTLNET